jgi:hypothetical protein
MGNPFLFRCPTTGQIVQGISGRDDQSSDGRRFYEGVLCPACAQVHIVNPATGRLMSEEIEDYTTAAVDNLKDAVDLIAKEMPSPRPHRAGDPLFDSRH